MLRSDFIKLVSETLTTPIELSPNPTQVIMNHAVTITDIVGCTALGIYCIPCSAPLKKDNVRRHLVRFHNDATIAMSPTKVRIFVRSLREFP